MILSDGYDSAPGTDIGAALQSLSKRGCRILWLNPLKGWRDYAPVAAGMAAALPHPISSPPPQRWTTSPPWNRSLPRYDP